MGSPLWERRHDRWRVPDPIIDDSSTAHRRFASDGAQLPVSVMAAAAILAADRLGFFLLCSHGGKHWSLSNLRQSGMFSSSPSGYDYFASHTRQFDRISHGDDPSRSSETLRVDNWAFLDYPRTTFARLCRMQQESQRTPGTTGDNKSK